MAADILIRRAGPGDAAALSYLFEALDGHHIRARPEEFLELAEPARSPEMIGKMIRARKGATILVAERRGAVVGLVHVIARTIAASVVSAEQKVAEVDSLVVREDARRQGVAGALMDAAEGWARSRGLERVDLKVRGFNAEALAFYAAIGFEPSVVRMTRRLGGETGTG